MTRYFDEFKIPTILGLIVIGGGILAGVYLISKEQIIISQASADFAPKDITVSNIDHSSATITWKTSAGTYSLVSFGESTLEKTANDERDTDLPAVYTLHSVRLKNLLSNTNYKFRIISNRVKTEVLTFKSATPAKEQNNFGPITGSIMAEGKPLKEGIVYLAIDGAITQSALINSSGNFLIPLSSIYKADLSDIYPLTEDTIVKLKVASGNNQSQITFKLSQTGTNLPLVNLGQDLDFIDSLDTKLQPAEATEEASPVSDQTINQGLIIYDLNEDGFINTADNAIVLKNFGKNPQNKKADLNSDGVVDNKDLTLMSEKINQFIDEE